ncbi:LysR family transcriptional regulator [Mycobacterium tuberculosis]|nr:LysR family transcriptional regulator [Mycobacterium tuberculosis]
MPLSSRMPGLTCFEIFLAIAEAGSLGGAARELGLTQQAVSRRLASMEAQIGVNRPGMSGDSSSWKGWGHVRWFIEEVPAGAA